MKELLLAFTIGILISFTSFGQIKKNDTSKINNSIDSIPPSSPNINGTQSSGGFTPGTNTIPNNTSPNAPIVPNTPSTTPSTAPSTSPGNPPNPSPQPTSPF